LINSNIDISIGAVDGVKGRGSRNTFVSPASFQ
jgi:hypothetical protein